MRATYKLLYKYNDEDSKETYFSSNFILPYKFIITHSDKESKEKTYRTELLNFFLKFKFNKINSLESAYNNNEKFSIEIEIENNYSINVRRDNFLSDEIDIAIVFFRECFLILNRLGLDESKLTDRYRPVCNNVYLYFNYLLIEIESYIISNDRLTAIKHCKNIIDEFIYKFTTPFETPDKIKFTANFFEEYPTVKKSFDELLDVIQKMTLLVGFKYEYDYNKSFFNYLSRLIELLDEELKTENIESTIILSKEAKEQILLNLCSNRNNRDKVKDILDEVDKRFQISKGKTNKLDNATICLILKEKCNLFNRSIKTFSEFKELVCKYYGIEIPTHKQNKCIDRFKELYEGSEYGAFWNYYLRKYN